MLTSVLKQLCRGSDLLVKCAGLAASVLMPVLTVVVAWEVFARYILNAPTIWGYDTALFLFGYIAALGGAWAQQNRAHITVDILYLKVSGNTRRVFDLITGSLGIFFLVLVVKMSYGKYDEAVEFDFRTQSEWAAPVFHFWIMMMVAASLFVMQLTRDLIANLYHLITGKPLMASDDDQDEDDQNGN
ncbi:TRAP transporter small permease subunit [Parathalassolituus penaei]|uniref:TRAP transporter small permease protein n=1 Tax=Parathalassolituus penaei TaxID=2997323 RepID=A0A9X3EAX2_9GAMM|nr:TRAP transporter small permease [Parathalassolituus penaei]MCY0963870.1 TRAP transporter small permease [Parathalassolituus penaei]